VRALRKNGERSVRLVGTDMSERSIGRHLCDTFHLVPPGTDASFAPTMLDIAREEEVDVVLPQSSFDLENLAHHRERFSPAVVLVSTPATVHACNNKAECYERLRQIGVRAPDSRRVRGATAVEQAAHELGYPERAVCFKPTISSGSRGYRVLDAAIDRGHALLNERPGFLSMRLEEAVELLPDADGPELLVMELAVGPERTVDGIADGTRVVLGHPKTREAIRAGLGMYFVTLDDPALIDVADAIITGFAIEHFFNIQLVGDVVIEINPRISTFVYQENLNIPYLGVKRALGEISDEALAAFTSLVRPGRTALRYFDQLEWDDVAGELN
jgi:carbamoyl-phosphate synthase large subunit